MKRILFTYLILQGLLLGVLDVDAQTPTLGFSGTVASGAAPSGSGPTTSPLNVIFRQSQNVASPPGAVYSPQTSVQFSLSNQQFSAIEGNPTIPGIVFGGTASYGTTLASNTVPAETHWKILSDPFTGTYTGNFTGCNTCTVGASNVNGSGLGVDGVRYGTLGSIGMSLYSDALIDASGNAIAGLTQVDANGHPSLTGRFYYGDLTLTFNRPVSNPVIHFSDIGGYLDYGTIPGGGAANNRYYGLGFATDFKLITPGLTLSKLSGTSNLQVLSDSIYNNATFIATPSSGNTLLGVTRYAASGSVKVNGENITTVTFKLWLRGDGGVIRDGNNNVASATTLNGVLNKVQWAFQGSFTPCHGQPGCTTSSSSTLITGTSPDYIRMAVGLQKPVNVSGHLWHDSDAGNVNSSSVVPIPAGVYANLIDNNGKVVTSMLIPESGGTAGQFSFDGVGEGTYTVNISTTQGVQGQTAPPSVLPSGWGSTGEFNGTSNTGNDGSVDGTSASFTVATTDVVDRNFGIRQVGSIRGNVSEDTNNDNTGENPISGVTIKLYNDVNNNGVYDSGTDTEVATTTTDASGNYSFTGLPQGNYLVVETQPAGYTSVIDNDISSDTGSDLANSNTNDNAIPVGLAASEDDIDNNFVERTVKGSISGNVSADSDFDDAGDVNIPGVSLTLYNDTNGDGILSSAELLAGPALIDSDNDGAFDDPGTVTTDASGNYTFPGVIPGNYIVVETQPAGYNSIIENDATPGDPGSDVANSDAHDDRIPVTVANNEADNNNNFIEAQIGSVSGNVKSDDNNDNVGDTNMPGVTMTLYRDTDGNGVLSPAEKLAGPVLIDSDLDGVFDDPGTVTTDASGNYTFYGVRPGVYLIEETQPTNYVTVSESDISADTGGDLTDASNKNDIIPVAVAPGEADGGNNFIEELSGRITGSVFRDIEKDDIVDKSEPVANITVSLLDGSGNPVLDNNGSPIVTTTDAAGFYEFPNRPPGNYIVEIGSIPSSDVLIYDNDDNSDGVNDGESNDGDTFNGRIPVTIAPGVNETDATNDFVISAITLPVKMILFEAISFNEFVSINWETSSETNNKGYEIYHSIDALNFNKIGFVPGKISANEKLLYSFTHNNPSYGTNYYQLNQIDLNGKISKSKIISTFFNNKEREIRFFPNPTNDFITVRGLSPEDMVTVSDNNGKVLVSSVQKGVEERLNLGKFPSGIYNVTIYRNGSVYTSKRIVKEQ